MMKYEAINIKQELNTEEWTMQIGDLQLKPIKRL